MRRLALAAALILAACSLPAIDTEAVPLPGVTVEGRYAETPDGVVFGYPGTRLLMEAGGPVTFNLDSRGTLGALDVRVDDGPWERVDLAEGAQMLPLGPDRPHRLEVVRRNEDWQGPLVVRSVSTPRGFTDSPALPDTKVLFIGDSITAGAGTDVAYEDAGLGKPLDNGRLAFPRVLAERLPAQVHQVAYGGRGALRDWRGNASGDTAEDGQVVLNMDAYYGRAVPSLEAEWDAGQWVPDAVVIGLGTNDFNSGVPEGDSFVDAYLGLIEQVRADAPDAPILILSSPMTGGAKGEAMRAQLDAVARRAGAGVHRMDTGIYAGRPSVVGHPTDAQQISIADEIEPVLRELLSH